jgi:hypothetical protein
MSNIEDLVIQNQNDINSEISEMYKTSQRLREQWSSTGLLEGIDDKYRSSCVAVLLENQRLINQNAVGSEGMSEVRDKFIPLVKKVYSSIQAWNWISFQSMLCPAGLAYYFRHCEQGGLEITSEEICARTRFMRRTICPDFGVNDIAYDIIDEIESEILTDLWNCCSKVGCIQLHEFEKHEKEAALASVIKEVHGSILGQVNYAVVNDGIYAEYRMAFSDLEKLVSIYPHKSVPGVLFGYKGQSFMDTSYVYSPYVPFTLTPLRYDGRYGLLTRYGKKLLREGSRSLGRLRIFKEKEEN